jgi:hypothetical protein
MAGIKSLCTIEYDGSGVLSCHGEECKACKVHKEPAAYCSCP